MRQQIGNKILSSVMAFVLFFATLITPVSADEVQQATDNREYSVIINQTEGGELILADNRGYEAGETVTLKVVANEGKELSNIQSAPETKINITNLTFIMPESDITLTPVYDDAEFMEQKSDCEEIVGQEGTEVVDQHTTEEIQLEESNASNDNTTEGENAEIAETDQTAIPAMLAKARAAGIVYIGKISYMGTIVGEFTVNGQTAFCMQHLATTPPTGTTFTEQIYSNNNILKVLYYGWAGPEQWSGFNSKEQGYVVTSLALSYFYDGSDSLGFSPNGSLAQKLGLSDFLAFINSEDIPDRTFTLSETYLESRLSADRTYQMTDDITLNADSRNTITIPLNEGMELVNKTTGETLTGNATVKGGDTFYLKAPLTMNGTWSTGKMHGSMGKFNAVVAMTAGAIQDIGYGLWATDPDSYVELSVKWVQMGDLKITKFLGSDSEIKKPATGAEFTLTHQETGEQVVIIADENGVATTEDRENYPIGRLIGGVWKVEETKSVDGYKPIDPFEVTITGQGEVFSYIVEDKEIFAAIKVVKTDAESGLVIPLAGTKFQILDENKNVISMTVSHYPSIIETDTFETDDSGSFVLPEKLEHGTYYLHEVQAPEGYLLGLEDIPFTVDAMTDWDTPLTIEYADTQAKGKIKIEKTDEATGELLAGVEFTVVAKEDITTQDGIIHANAGDVVATIVTDENGIAETDELNLGTYTVKETGRLQGYILPEQSWDVKLAYQDQHTNIVVETLSITNKQTEVTIKKTEAGSENPLEGVEFAIWNKAFVSDEVDPGMAIKETFVTDENGTIILRKLEPGTYCVQETASLPGYILDSTVREFTISENGMYVTEDGTETETGVVEFVNDYTKLYLSKQDATTGEELPGAEMELKDSNGNLIEKWTSTDEPHIIEKIIPGDYILHEEVAPDGYKLAQDITFTVEETGTVQKVVMQDELSIGSISVEMQDNSGNGIFSVKTGDKATPLIGLMLSLAGAAIAITATVYFRRRKKVKNDEE